MHRDAFEIRLNSFREDFFDLMFALNAVDHVFNDEMYQRTKDIHDGLTGLILDGTDMAAIHNGLKTKPSETFIAYYNRTSELFEVYTTLIGGEPMFAELSEEEEAAAVAGTV